MDIQSIILSDSDVVPEFNIGLFVVILILIFLSAFFSMSETAFSSASKVKMKVAVEDRKSGAKKALELTESFDKTLTTLLVGNNLVNVALSTISVTFFTLLAIGAEWISLVSTLVVTVVLLIFGEIVPKMLAKANPENVAYKVSYIVYILRIILYPFILFFTALQKLISRNQEKKIISQDELLAIMDEMIDDGTLEEENVNIIKNVLDIKDRIVKDIMVPRMEMEAIDYSWSLEEVKELVLASKYSRIPVYKKDKDNIVGVLHIRDFYPALLKNNRLSWKRIIKPVHYVASTMKVDDLIKNFQNNKSHLAVVSGEYGDVIGIVTMEDAIEEIIGEIYDEHDIFGDKDLYFEKISDDSYIVDGEYYIEDLFEDLGIGDAPEDVPSKISSWVFSKCESLPEVGFSFKYLAMYTKANEEDDEYIDYAKMLTISISKVENRRIELLKIDITDATEEEIEEFENKEEE